MRRVKESLPQISEDLPELPLLAHRALRKAVDGSLTVQWQSAQLEQIRDEIRGGNQRTQASLAGATLTLSGVLAAGLLDTTIGFNPLWLAAGLGGVGLLLLAWALTR